MSKTLKVVSLVVAMVLLIGVIATIAILSSENSVAVSSASAAKASSDAAAAAAKPVGDPALIVDGQKVTDPGVILTVGDTEFSFDEYRYYYMSALSYDLKTLGTDFTTSDGIKAAAKLKTTVDDSLTQMAAILQIAKDQGIALTAEEKAEVKASLDEQKESINAQATSGGQDFDAQLKSAYLIDEAFFLKILEQNKLAQKAQDYITDELLANEKTKTELEKGLVSAKHILIPFETTTTDAAGSSVSISGEQLTKNKEEAKALADSLSKEIKESSDPVATFNTLFTEYHENDPGQPDTGYTFADGQMVESFYKGSLALKENEVSGPIESSYGYHIILRLPLDQENVKENISTLAGTTYNTLLDKKIEEVSKKLEVTYGKYYDDISPSTVE